MKFYMPENKASVRLAEKLDVVLEKTIDFRNGRRLLYRHKNMTE